MVFRWLRERRRQQLLETPIPNEWVHILDADVRPVAALDPERRERLEQMVRVFIAEKRFEGCGGLELTDRMRVVIAAQACMLILELDHDLYSDVETILVYPSAMYSPHLRRDGVLESDGMAITGEAHQHGPIILAWDAVRHGAYNGTDGRNVVYHEFAHALDMLSDGANGAPPLASREARAAWASAFGEAYAETEEKSDRGLRSFFGDYAATHPAEMFAVATERFFEQPKRMKQEYPEVYRVMAEFFRQDPATLT